LELSPSYSSLKLNACHESNIKNHTTNKIEGEF